MNTHVLVAYASDHGTTRQVAHAVTEGASSLGGCIAEARDVEMLTVDDVRQRDALVLGSPVHMGSCHWAMKRFIDRVLGSMWATGTLEGKVGAIFSTGSGKGEAGAGAELNMLSMLAVLAELGLILVPLPGSVPDFARSGLHWGPFYRTRSSAGCPELLDLELRAARRHGLHVARIAQRMQLEPPFESNASQVSR